MQSDHIRARAMRGSQENGRSTEGPDLTFSVRGPLAETRAERQLPNGL